MLLSVAAAVVTAPVLWFVGSLAGVATVTLLQEVRVERQVRRIRRQRAYDAGSPSRFPSPGPA
ncbi:hypothetical protein GCM10010532_061520 [Dactylosporangium siamense]|uniref:Uncharacterized protein n=1 Tax=Dactylosporangium siamense TaxID=685454 RepID=A0A919PVH5_9ACTN|nr:hypothetical protein Dsi01nite_080870 [Dactylosporangium siamense]